MLALTVLGDRDEAEEAAQDAFLSAFRHADACDPRRGKVATWLLGAESDSGPSPMRTKGQVRGGAPPGTRTPNPRIKSPLLCQLS